MYPHPLFDYYGPGFGPRRQDEKEKVFKLKELKRLEIKDTIGDTPPLGKLGTYAEWITPGILYVAVQGNPKSQREYHAMGPEKYFTREYVVLAKDVEAAIFELNAFETTYLPSIEEEFKAKMKELQEAYDAKVKAEKERYAADMAEHKKQVNAAFAKKPRKTKVKAP